MQRVGTLTEDALIVGADVVLVHPVQGGGGAAHLLYNSVHIEAVLVTPQAELPEVLRLKWLLAQLNLDVFVFSKLVPGPRQKRTGALAMIPPVLTATEHVELTRLDQPTAQQAVSA